MLSASSRFSLQRLPALGQRVVYVSGPTMMGAGQVIALVPRKNGIYVRVMMDQLDERTGGSFKVVKVQSLYEEFRSSSEEPKP